VAQAEQVARNARRARATRPDDGRLRGLVARLEQTTAATHRLGDQTSQRLRGTRQIPDRLISLADPDARPIRKGKPHKPTEFGYTVLLAECERGFIASHHTHQGNPPDAAQLLGAVTQVIAITGRPPGAVAGDRGFGTDANDTALAALGVDRVGLPRNGTPGKARQAYEQTRRFKRLRHWRVGIEARISQLKRSFGLRRTRLRRLAGAQTWVGLGIFAYNLQRMTVVAG
jgi:transposase, IS5 family